MATDHRIPPFVKLLTITRDPDDDTVIVTPTVVVDQDGFPVTLTGTSVNYDDIAVQEDFDAWYDNLLTT